MIDDLLNELERESSKCISCGFCDSVCPTYKTSGYDMTKTSRGRAQIGYSLFKELKSGNIGINVSDTFYSCLECHVCLQVCPTGVDSGRISDLSKTIISSVKKYEKPEAKAIVRNIMKYSKPLIFRDESYSWYDNVKAEKCDTLLYTGLMYQLMPYTENLERLRKKMGKRLFYAIISLAEAMPGITKLLKPDPSGVKRANKTLKNIVYALKSSDVSFDLLEEEEPYPGSLLYEYGYIVEFREYIKRIYKILGKYQNIITIDPHTYNLLKYEYPKYIPDFNLNVIYYLDMVDKNMLYKSNEYFAFHDPCHFQGEHLYNNAREIIENMGNVSYPERNGSRTYCCGGPDELLFPDISKNISAERYNQLKNISGNIVTSCPICLYSLSRNGNIKDIADVIQMHLKNRK